MKQNGKVKKLAFLFILCLCVGTLSGCGDGIKKDTQNLVTEKTNQALQLYSDIEKQVKEHQLQADKAFIDMKKQLTDMSEKIKTGISETTEEDGQLASQELDKIIENLQNVKEKVQKSIEAVAE
ncbi:MAG: hypothetical protein J1F22_05330 [Lachnospiraceae bacterium]|nr:hypothetical protein [Lachnospiraceae bacterium]